MAGVTGFELMVPRFTAFLAALNGLFLFAMRIDWEPGSAPIISKQA